MTRRTDHCLVLLAFISFLIGHAAQAQNDPRPVLAGIINQLQHGQPNPAWYGPDLWMTISSQTGNSGYYPALAQLGPVQNITVIARQALPLGELVAMSVQHSNGVSNWRIGITYATNRVEYLDFQLSGQPMPMPLPDPPPDPVPPYPNPNPNPPPPPPPGNSDACKMFPDLC